MSIISGVLEDAHKRKRRLSLQSLRDKEEARSPNGDLSLVRPLSVPAVVVNNNNICH